MSRHSAGSSGATPAPCAARHPGQRPGQHGHTRAGEHERHDRLALVGLHRQAGWATDGGERRVEHVTSRRAYRLGDERQARESGQRQPAGHLPAGRQRGHELLAAERVRHDPLGGHRNLRDPQLAVPGPQQVDQLTQAVRVGEAHHHAGMGLAEGADERGHRVDGERRQGHEVEAPAHHVGHRGHLGPGGIDGSQDLPGRRHEGLAGRRQPRPPADPVEQLDAQVAFERPDRVRQRRLGHEAGGGRGREGAVLDDGQGVAQLLQFHRSTLWVWEKIGLGQHLRSRGHLAPCPGSRSCAIGTVVGFLGGLFGKGGSALATPLLAAVGVPPIIAVASPLPATVPGTLIAHREYRRFGLSDPEVIRWSIAVGVPATVVGAVLTIWIGGGALVRVTDVVVALLGLRSLLFPQEHEVVRDDLGHRRLRLVLIAAGVGLLSGLLANAGGFLLVPLYLAALRLPIKTALACSLAVAAALAVPGTIVHAILGHIDWAVTAVFAAASIPMSRLGARTALRLHAASLERIYGAGLLVLGAVLLVPW